MSAFSIFDWNWQDLTGIGIKPAHGKIQKAVVLLHGFMGDAESNAEFAKKICKACPETLVLVPDAPQTVPPENDSHHRQWYPLPATADEDGWLYSAMPCYAPAEKQKQIRETTPLIQKTASRLNKMILEQIKLYGLTLSDCFLAGISQGGITAYEMVLFRKELHCDEAGRALSGLIIIGAGINEADRLNLLSPRLVPPIPVLLARGKRDEIFPKTVDCFSAAQLRLLQMPVETVEADSVHFGLEHAVCDDVCRFIRRHS